MTERIPSRAAAVALAFVSASGCTGLIDSPLGPGGGKNGSNEANTNDVNGASPDGVGGEAPANVGTQVFALCEGGEEAPGPRLLRLMTRREYRNTARDLLHIDAPDVSTLPVEARVRGFDNNAGSAAVTARHIDEYLTLAQKLAAEAVQKHKAELVSCAPTSASCAKTFVTEFGLRAFRRPLTDEEVSRYTALFADSLTRGDFDEGLRLTISALMITPNFLYRSEVGDAQSDGTFKLNSYEIASALSYLFWASMPDQTLFDLAAKDALSTTDALAAQAERMLKDARARDQLGEFSMQWLRSDNVVNANKDKSVYPNFSDALREAMIREQSDFVNRVVLDQNGKFGDLFVADFVMANRDLATFYGLVQPQTEGAPVPVTKESGRGGLLGLGAVLAAHAHANESSPIKRGLFVRDRLLCQNMSPPPPSVDATPPGLDPTLTTRERFAQHTSDPACSGCHQYIDGVGFGFEGFDGIGQKRELENGLPIDTTGTVVGLEGLNKNTKETFNGPGDLAAMLADSATAQACLALQYYRFARGYEERKSDACSLSALKDRFDKTGLTVKELLTTLPQLKSFAIRSAE